MKGITGKLISTIGEQLCPKNDHSSNLKMQLKKILDRFSLQIFSHFLFKLQFYSPTVLFTYTLHFTEAILILVGNVTVSIFYT